MLEVVRIDEWPYGKTTWVRLDEAAGFVGLTPAELRTICSTIGARIINYGYAIARPGGNAHDKKHADFIDFGILGKSASWRQLMASKESIDSQGVLF